MEEQPDADITVPLRPRTPPTESRRRASREPLLVFSARAVVSLKDQLVLDELLCFALYSASRSMTLLYRSYLEESDLTYPQFLVLFLLWKEDGRAVSSIGETLLLDGGTVSPLLQRMETKGLIRRQRSTADERVVHVFLTDAGKALESTLLPKVAGGMLCDLQMEAGEVAAMASKIHDVRRTIELASKRGADK